ncbi:E2 early protein [Bos taurus papillomavirus 34]|nr:E2 early protein [Bos taurus papillomavirus 34]
MENLEARFDAVQEALLQIYETDSYTLEVCIAYWALVRKEHALYYHARKQGKTRLGLYPVPPARVSEQKAKDAIKISLYLESLQKSEFANVGWSLVDTSLESFLAPPDHTFKKRGKSVTVIYDADANNSMVYTMWTEIYGMDENDKWYRSHSEVDYDGIFFWDAQGNKIYYVNFHDDAALYSKLGRWEVHFEQTVLSPPVTSSIPGPGRGRHGAQTGEHASRQSPVLPPRQSSVGNTGDPRGRRQRSQSPARSRSRSRSPARNSHTGRRTPELSGPGGGGRGSGGGRQPQDFGRQPPPSPEEVGTRLGRTERKASSRLARLIEDAYDPPVLLLQGPQNTLKCYRRRATHSYPHKFLCMSTSWTWASKTSSMKSGHRMLIAFANKEQRDLFVGSVRLPKGVTAVKGSLDGL